MNLKLVKPLLGIFLGLIVFSSADNLPNCDEIWNEASQKYKVVVKTEECCYKRCKHEEQCLSSCFLESLQIDEVYTGYLAMILEVLNSKSWKKEVLSFYENKCFQLFKNKQFQESYHCYQRACDGKCVLY